MQRQKLKRVQRITTITELVVFWTVCSTCTYTVNQRFLWSQLLMQSFSMHLPQMLQGVVKLLYIYTILNQCFLQRNLGGQKDREAQGWELKNHWGGENNTSLNAEGGWRGELGSEVGNPQEPSALCKKPFCLYHYQCSLHPSLTYIASDCTWKLKVQ